MSLVKWEDVARSCADGYRTASGTTESVPVGQLGELIGGLSTGGGGDDTLALSIIEGTITELVNTKITKIRSYAFIYCSTLTRVVIVTPQAIPVGDQPFRYCTGLTFVDFSPINLGQHVFGGCSALKTIILRTKSVCSLLNQNSFTYTPFASGGTGGTIYVPEALIESYQTATNWSAMYARGTCTFLPIEGSEYE